jgi:hypothetical protein
VNQRIELCEHEDDRRFPVRHLVFAVLRTSMTKLGVITDMGMDGVSFRYFDDEPWPEGPFFMDILVHSDRFYLRGLLVETLSDWKLAHDSPFSSITMRIRSVRFKGLSPKQESRLGDILKRCARDKA